MSLERRMTVRFQSILIKSQKYTILVRKDLLVLNLN
jgi:hypothetical protein